MRNARLTLLIAALPTVLLLAALMAAVLPEPLPHEGGDRSTPAQQDSAMPRYYLWAWQRSEDLGFIDPANTGVALWTGAITVVASDLQVEHRSNPVSYPHDTEVVAVVRLEIPGAHATDTATRVAESIVDLSAPFKPAEYQIDFDARHSQREFYRELLTLLRQRLGSTPLSITALASWCFRDPWVSTLPVDSVVAMLYRMGPEGAALRHELTTRPQFPVPLCQHQVGYSSDEPVAPVAALQRVFLYHPQPWTKQAFLDFRSTVADTLP